MQNKLINQILRHKNTVFSFQDLAILSKESREDLLAKRISYYISKGEIIQVRKGIYAKNENYESKELASKIYKPSYISLMSVLREAGVIFQYNSEISSVSYLSRDIEINSIIYSYKKIKDTVLMNTKGIIQKENYMVATTERAFLDSLYLFPNSHFDNLAEINWDFCSEIVEIYENNSLKKRLEKYQKFQEENY